MPMRLSRVGRARAGAGGPTNCSARSGWPTARDRGPERMSGGEQQRTAIATALANRPRRAARRRADRRAGHRERPRRVRRAADRQHRARRDRPGRDARPGRVRRRSGGRWRSATAGPARETLRQATTDEAGSTPRSIAVEYAVLDRAGRVQLPREMIGRLGMRDRVRLEAGARPHRRVAGPGHPAGRARRARQSARMPRQGRAEMAGVPAAVPPAAPPWSRPAT